jgi:hypothetical protein
MLTASVEVKESTMLKDVITAHGLTGTAAEVHALLIVKDIVQRHEKLNTDAETMDAVLTAGHDLEVVIPAIQSTHVGKLLISKLSSTGVDWADPKSKMILGGLVANHPSFTQSMMDTLVEMNEKDVSIVEQHGLPNPTEAEVQTALDEIEFESSWAAAQNTHINAAVASGDKATLAAALRAAADSL